jgi:hypothetical protein
VVVVGAIKECWEEDETEEQHIDKHVDVHIYLLLLRVTITNAYLASSEVSQPGMGPIPLILCHHHMLPTELEMHFSPFFLLRTFPCHVPCSLRS